MEEFFYSQQLDSRRSLCIGPLTRKEAASLPDSLSETGNCGLYLFTVEAPELEAEVRVIAKLASVDMAAQMANMLRAGKLELAAGF